MKENWYDELRNEKLRLEIFLDWDLYERIKPLWQVSREELREWIDALESGDFKQGRERLYKPKENSFCCLGIKAKQERNLILHEDGSYRFKCGDKIGSNFSLEGHLRVPRLGELPFLVDCFYETNPCHSLASMNDRGWSSFKKIAWVLKKLYWILFEEKYEKF